MLFCGVCDKIFTYLNHVCSLPLPFLDYAIRIACKFRKKGNFFSGGKGFIFEPMGKFSVHQLILFNFNSLISADLALL